MSELPTVGVIGVGDMGAGIAEAILRAGFPLAVYDVRAEAVHRMVEQGARAVDSVPDACRVCEVLVVVVVDDAQVDQVCATVAADPGAVTSVVISSTVLPRTVVQAAELLQSAGVALVDAPVSGGREKATLGALTIMLGGDEADIAACSAVLGAYGRNRFHVGPVGAGSAAKLVNNLLSLGSHTLQLEAMQLAAAYGISEETATEFITVSAGDSRGIRTWGRIDRIRTTHTLVGTPQMYEIYAKDLVAAVRAAGHRDVSLPMTAVAAGLIGPKMMERDRELAHRPPGPSIPRCAHCDQELASPFRAAWHHPECTA